jgi:CubicO group peptidase (beta-lactamase class C family)
MKYLCILLAFGVTFAAPPTNSKLEEIRSAVQNVLNEEAILYNTSFQAGFSHETIGEFGVAAGKFDASSSSDTLMHPDTMIPVGSATKAYTAATIIKLVDEGTIDLDLPASYYVDPVLTRLNGTTLLKLWKGDKTISTVTVRHLLHMSSGIHDYDDEALQVYTREKAGEDKTGIDMLYELNKEFLFQPGKGGSYTSVGYVLLGYVLVGATSHLEGGTWNDFDQRSFMTKDQKMRWNRTSFPKMGRCTNYDVPKQFTYQQVGTEAVFFDLGQASCLNGWTCGNMAASAKNIASFWNDLVGQGRIVSSEGLYNMTQFDPLTTGFAPGLPYGLGLMSLFKTFPDPDFESIGHAGQDYASGAPLSEYNVKYKFGAAVTTNSFTGMNCTNLAHQGSAGGHAGCRVRNVIINILSNGTAKLHNCDSHEHLTYLTKTVGPHKLGATIKKLHASLASVKSRHRNAVAAEQQGTCSGKPVFVVPYVADGNCNEMSSKYGGPFFYVATVSGTNSVTVNEWFPDQSTGASKCQGKASSPPHPQSPFTVPLDSCFRTTPDALGNTYDIDFFLNETTGIVFELVWKVDTIKSCAWWNEGIPGLAPSPSPSPVMGDLYVQSYSSNNCDPSTIIVRGSEAWSTVPIDSCLRLEGGKYFALGCKGTVVNIKLDCSDNKCAQGCKITNSTMLGECTFMGGESSSRIIYLAAPQCPN